MLRAIRVNAITIDLVVVVKNSIVDGIGNSKFDRVKVSIKMTNLKSQDKSKSNNLIKSLTKIST